MRYAVGYFRILENLRVDDRERAKQVKAKVSLAKGMT